VTQTGSPGTGAEITMSAVAMVSPVITSFPGVLRGGQGDHGKHGQVELQ